MNIKTRLAQNLGLSTTVHLTILVLLGAFFVYKHYEPKTEYITVSFGVENPAPKPVVENELEPASGKEDEDVEAMLNSLPPLPQTVTKTKAAKKPAAHKAVNKKTASKTTTGGKTGVLGADNGNSNKPAQAAPKDYLELLQYTVQERSNVPIGNPNLRGRAVLHLAFNRQGYVLAYTLNKAPVQQFWTKPPRM